MGKTFFVLALISMFLVHPIPKYIEKNLPGHTLVGWTCQKVSDFSQDSFCIAITRKKETIYQFPLLCNLKTRTCVEGWK